MPRETMSIETGLGAGQARDLSTWAEQVRQAVAEEGCPPATLIELAREQFGDLIGARHAQVWDALAQMAAVDLDFARTVEPHLDALTIIRQAQALPQNQKQLTVPEGSTWGVFAAEAPGTRLEARPASGLTDRWELTGVKPWCSRAEDLSHAVVTAHVEGGRRAFAVALSEPEAVAMEHEWASRGLRAIPSGAVEFRGAPAVPLGGTDWYLSRPGFAWGGIGVAACWFGGAAALARTALAVTAPKAESEVRSALIGQIDAHLHTCRLTLAAAARVPDGEAPSADDSDWTLALRVRNIVFRAATEIQRLSRELAGPALLTGDERFAKTDADLTVYLSQHHGTRDEAALGQRVLEDGAGW